MITVSRRQAPGLVSWASQGVQSAQVGMGLEVMHMPGRDNPQSLQEAGGP